MLSKSVRKLLVLCYLLSEISGAQLGNGPRNEQLKYVLDLSNCGVLDKPCSHIGDELSRFSCALNIAHNKTQVIFPCQHKLWKYQVDMMSISFLNYKLRDVCQDEALIMDCLDLEENNLDCVLKKKPSVKDTQCRTTISTIESLIFNDWQITKNFLKNCFDEIEVHTCGRIPQDNSLSQTQTLKCLQNQKLNVDCMREVDDLKDVKYNTLQLDRIVFAACNKEQKKFCSDEISGSWLMYKCLLRHKYEPTVSRRCQDQLLFDQRNMVMNYRMSKGLVKACKDDIRKYRCRKGIFEDKDVRLAQMLLCLENVARNDSTAVSGECLMEMTDHRKMLMDDYRLSPELMQNCANDIKTLCKGIEAEGKTIHCLMDHARPRRRKEKRISPECQKSLETIVESANPGEDWRVDPLLHKACRPVVDKACYDLIGGNGRVMSCLMEKLGTAAMTSECEAALLQIQYFISRDFKLDPQLYKACKYDAVTQCKAKHQWADASEQQSEKDAWIFPCLYKYAYNSKVKDVLKPGCKKQIKRVMRQRAQSADLLPEVEDYCIDDLANLCYEHTGKGEEILCLQSKIQILSSLKCREAVANFTETQSGHIELNTVLNVNCGEFIEQFCALELKSSKDEDDVKECLISHKNEPEIKANPKCRAVIEHEQLISLKNYRFTRKFKNACKSYVIKFCPDAQTKNQVVKCLSEIVRNDTITKSKHTIFKDCRQQLRSQLFQQKENIDLDPELSEACKNDLQSFCPHVPHGESAALECLQTAGDKLTKSCKRAIFIVKRQEFADSAVDFHLVTTCNNMIDIFCPQLLNTETSKVLDCLKVYKDKPNFNEDCKVVVVNRLIERNTDYRLNANLISACDTDINSYCSDIIRNEPEVELQGKVLYCLKGKFRESKLTKTCENQLAEILKEQALNYRLDPLLGKLCSAEIQTICAVPHDSVTNADGQVEECLKKALLDDKIVSRECKREVVQIIEETEVDIDADPLLEEACRLDLLTQCAELEHGAGRRLKCLKIILNDDSRHLDPKCEKALSGRLEMYKYVAAETVVKDLGDVYVEISSSPSKKYFLVVFFSVIGLIFIFGLYCGRLTKKAMYVKRK